MSAPAPAPGPTRTRGWLLLVLVLVLGLLMGASAMVLLHHLGWGPPEPRSGPARGMPRPEGPPPEDALRHLERALDLDEAQRVEVERILESRREEIDALMRGTHEEIRALLSPEQQKKLDALHERREERGRGEGRGRRRGRPPR